MVSNQVKARGQVSLVKLYDGTNGKDGKDGDQGVPGPPGADGRTTYVHVAYADSADGKTNFSITDPTDRKYIGVLTDFNINDSTNYSDYTWSLAQGPVGSTGAPGAKGEDGRTTYVHVAYSNSSDGSSAFSTTDPTNRYYIGVLTDFNLNDSTNPSDYTWSLAKGADGKQGIPGPIGPDGRTSYVHFAYANSADGSVNFDTSNPDGRAYIGTYTDFSINDSTKYTDYTWSLVKGADGEQGIPGPVGPDGRTSYVHFSYAKSADGSVGFSTTDPTGATYIGTYTDFTINDSTDYASYTWSRMKGDTGNGVANTVTEYQITTTQTQPSDTSGWTTTIPNIGAGVYLWTRTTFVYTDGTKAKSYTVSRQSDNVYTAVLTNDSITLPSDASGNVTDFSSSNGQFLVYDGAYQVDPTTVTIQVAQQVNVTVATGGSNYSITSMDSTKDSGYFDLSYTYKGVLLTKRVSVSKSKRGTNGSNPVIISLSATSQVFTFDSNDKAYPVNQNINFSTVVSGTSDTPVYTAIPYTDTDTAGTAIVLGAYGTNGKQLQVSQIGTYQRVVVTVTAGGATDTTTIVKVKDGSSISPIPDPSNTVSSATPPTNPKEGDWWNDTSQTPNVLKYCYRDKWVQYELDGYYVKANSISGEAIVTNTLEAQKIKYTNSDGTTTNLQTFDLKGMQTAMTDSSGHTYTSMENAVRSTQSFQTVDTKVKNLQVGGRNLFLNSKKLSWSVSSNGADGHIVAFDDTTNMLHITAPSGYGTGTGVYIYQETNIVSSRVQNGQQWAMSFDIKGTGNFANGAYIGSEGSNNYSGPTGAIPADWKRVQFTGTATQTGGAIILYFGASNSPLDVYIKLPKLEIGNMPTDWTPAPEDIETAVSKAQADITKTSEELSQKVSRTDYDNNNKVLNESISRVQQTADGAVSSVQAFGTKLDNMSVGGRNYILNSRISIAGNNTFKGGLKSSVPTSKFSNQPFVVSVQVDYDNITAISGGKRLGFEIQLHDTTTGQNVWKGAWKYPQLGESFHGRIHTVYQNTGEQYIDNSENTIIEGIYIQGIEGTNVKVSNPKLEFGTFATDYSPAPEDAESQIVKLSQTNLLNNSKFSPDFSGWHIDSPWGALVTDQLTVNGLADETGSLYVWHNADRSGNWIFSDPVKLSGGTPTLSTSLKVAMPTPSPDGTPIAIFVYSYDENHNIVTSTGYNIPVSNLDGTFKTFKVENAVLGAGTVYVSMVLGWNRGGDVSFGEPMLVNGPTVGEYVPSGYNNNFATQSNITQTADQIKESLGSANLFPNSEFEKDYGYSRLNGNATLSLGVKNDIDGHLNGTFEVTSTAPDWQGYWARNIPVYGGQSYSMSTLVHYTNGGLSNGNASLDVWFIDKDGNRISTGTIGPGGYNNAATGQVSSPYWVKLYLENLIAPTNAVYMQVSLIVNNAGAGQYAMFTQPMVTATEKLQKYAVNNDITTQMDLMVDKYTLGISNDGKLVSGIQGNTQQLTLKGNVITLDSGTVVAPDFIAKNIKTDNLSSISATLGDVTSGSITNPINQAWSAGTGTTLLGTTVIDKRGINMNADIKTASNPKVYSETLSISPDTGIKFSWRDYSGGTSLPPVPLDVTMDRNGLVALSGKYSSVVGGDSISVNNGRDGTAVSLKAAATSDSGMGGVSAGGVTTSDYIRYVTEMNGTQNLPLVMGLERIGNMVMVSFNFVTYGSTIRADQMQMGGPKIPVGFRPLDNVHIQANANNSGNHIAVITFTITPDGRVLQTSPAINGASRIMGSGFYLTYMVGGGPGSIIVDAQGDMS